jgi:hypothetical protein
MVEKWRVDHEISDIFEFGGRGNSYNCNATVLGDKNKNVAQHLSKHNVKEKFLLEN